MRHQGSSCNHSNLCCGRRFHRSNPGRGHGSTQITLMSLHGPILRAVAKATAVRMERGAVQCQVAKRYLTLSKTGYGKIPQKIPIQPFIWSESKKIVSVKQFNAINHPPVITMLIGGINHENMDFLAAIFPLKVHQKPPPCRAWASAGWWRTSTAPWRWPPVWCRISGPWSSERLSTRRPARRPGEWDGEWLGNVDG